MTDIFQEVDQSLREETVASAWKRWQWVVYGVIAAIIITVGVLEFLRSQRDDEINRSAVIYDAAFTAREKNDLAAARTGFAELQGDKTGFNALAGHMLAGVEKDLTNDMTAVEAHLASAVAADKGVMGDLALLKLGYAKADTVPLAELEATLKPLLDRQGQASALARELIALKALAGGDIERARTELETLALDLEAPGGVQARVQQALSTLPARTVNLDNTPAPAPAAPAPAQPTQAPPVQAPQ